MPDSITGGPRRDASAAYTEYALCYPPHPVFTRLSELFMAAFARSGADPLIGRHRPVLFRHAGLAEIEVTAHAPI
jgi:hypothetical protein